MSGSPQIGLRARCRTAAGVAARLSDDHSRSGSRSLSDTSSGFPGFSQSLRRLHLGSPPRWSTGQMWGENGRCTQAGDTPSPPPRSPTPSVSLFGTPPKPLPAAFRPSFSSSSTRGQPSRDKRRRIDRTPLSDLHVTLNYRSDVDSPACREAKRGPSTPRRRHLAPPPPSSWVNSPARDVDMLAAAPRTPRRSPSPQTRSSEEALALAVQCPLAEKQRLSTPEDHRPVALSPSLAIGTARFVGSPDDVLAEGFTHVISLCPRMSMPPRKALEAEGVKVCIFDATDDGEYQILRELYTKCRHIYREVLARGGRLLVQCYSAVNRSVTIAVALRMGVDGIRLMEAVETVAAKRRPVLQNAEFRRQLVRFSREPAAFE